MPGFERLCTGGALNGHDDGGDDELHGDDDLLVQASHTRPMRDKERRPTSSDNETVLPVVLYQCAPFTWPSQVGRAIWIMTGMIIIISSSGRKVRMSRVERGGWTLV